MKKPYYGEIEREIIKMDNTLFASLAKLKLASNRFAKVFIKAFFRLFTI